MYVFSLEIVVFGSKSQAVMLLIGFLKRLGSQKPPFGLEDAVLSG